MLWVECHLLYLNCKTKKLFPKKVLTHELGHWVLFFNCSTEATSMNDLRMKVFLDKSAQNLTTLCSKDLPPTSSSARYHALHAYYQVLEWKGFASNPCDYGWERVNDCLVPKMTDSMIGPDNILKVVRCSCKAGCKTMSCTCRKLGLKCSIVCKHCDGSFAFFPIWDISRLNGVYISTLKLDSDRVVNSTKG